VGKVGAFLTCTHAVVARSKASVGGRVACALLPCLLGLAVLLSGPSALAREPTSEDRTTARELAQEGFDALQAFDYALAADRFKRADALVHAPTLLVDLGRSYAGLGQLVSAHEAFQQVLREGVPANAPAPWLRALAAAREEDEKVKPRLAWVTIRVEGASEPHLKLDGVDLPPASLGVRRAVDPGRRTVVAEAEGFLSVSNVIELGEGEAGELALVLKPDPTYKPAAEPALARRVVVVPAAPSSGRTPAYVAYGVGATGLLLSGVTTILMLRTRDNLAANCHDGLCPDRVAGDVSRFPIYGTLAAVGLGVGLAGAGVGTYFWLSDKQRDKAARSGAVTARLAPGYVSLSGRF
jgi:hypothetical protein